MRLLFGVKSSFIRIAAGSTVLAGFLGSCAAFSTGDSGFNSSVTRLSPNECVVELTHDLRTIPCWVRCELNHAVSPHSAVRARLNGVTALGVSTTSGADNRVVLDIRTRTRDGGADSVFSWGTGDPLVLTLVDSVHTELPRVRGWTLFRADGDGRTNDNSSRAFMRELVRFLFMVFGLIAVVGAVMSVDTEDKSHVQRIMIDEIDLVEWRDGRTTALVRKVLKAIILDNKDVSQAMDELGIKDSVVREAVKTGVSEKSGVVVDGYFKQLALLIPPGSRPPGPVA